MVIKEVLNYQKPINYIDKIIVVVFIHEGDKNEYYNGGYSIIKRRYNFTS